ncbi:hypothetical protein ACSBR1_015387 [Camellia fascicularis]
MKSKGWKLAQSYQWVIDRRPPVELTQAVYRQLQEYEQKIFGLIENNTGVLPVFTSSAVPSFSFGFPKPNNPVPLPTFNNPIAPSTFAHLYSVFDSDLDQALQKLESVPVKFDGPSSIDPGTPQIAMTCS